MSAVAQGLFLRISLRKGPWIRAEQVRYDDVPDATEAIEQARSAALLDVLSPGGPYPAASLSDLDAIVACVPVRLLDMAWRGLPAGAADPAARRGRPWKNRAGLEECLRGAARRHGAPAVLGAVLAETGPVLAVPGTVLTVLARLQRLFFLAEGQSIGQFMAARAGGARYPQYTIRRTRPVWGSRGELLDYERAVANAGALLDALEVICVCTRVCACAGKGERGSRVRQRRGWL